MADITQLDEIDEDYIVSALSDIQSVSDTLDEDISIEDVFEEKPLSKESEPLDIDIEEDVAIEEKDDSVQMNLNSAEADNIMELLKQLIDGKTLEISIKVKD